MIGSGWILGLGLAFRGVGVFGVSGFWMVVVVVVVVGDDCLVRWLFLLAGLIGVGEG